MSPIELPGTAKKEEQMQLKKMFLKVSFDQMVGTFFIKASTYEFMKFHDLGNAETYFYSFEHYGGPSLWNFLFPGGIPGDPIPRYTYPARARSAWARRACALRALGLLLADGAPTVGRGKTF